MKTLPQFESEEILKAFVKGYSIVNNPMYKNIACSISGGADSDIMLDIIHRIDVNKKVTYVWFDTGFEYKATKEHLKYLEDKYGIEIQRKKAVQPIPACVHKYGQPFLSKFVSEQIFQLQNADFEWEDDTFENLSKKYPTHTSALKWWCNCKSTTGDIFNISRNKYLKEFLIANPPTFRISNRCCKYAKKKVAQSVECDLMITGIRKYEGGIRANIYKNCYSTNGDDRDYYRPLFWFRSSDKKEYEEVFGIRHSDCYEKWGFERTGCTCCPYSKHLEFELSETLKNEPMMYKAVNQIFKESYEYTRQYRLFQKEMREKALEESKC